MPVSGVSGTSNNTNETNAPLGGTGQGAVDKDAFLKLLVAQLSHQDPLKPTDGTEFVTQLAQFSTVEQQIAQSAKLELISLQLSGLASNEAASLVGKTVTVKGDGVVDFKGGAPEGSTTSIGEGVQDATVQLVDSNGNVVAESGPKNIGAGPVPLDGLTPKGGQGIPDGSYTVKVVDKAGKDVATNERVTGVVTQVSFEKGYPELVLDNGVTVPVSDLISVEGGPGSGAGAGGTGGAGTALAGGPSSALLQSFNQYLQSLGQ